MPSFNIMFAWFIFIYADESKEVEGLARFFELHPSKKDRVEIHKKMQEHSNAYRRKYPN